jgi:hypothetical protein
LNIHPSTLREHLAAMDRKGYVTWDERVFRSITVCKGAVPQMSHR